MTSNKTMRPGFVCTIVWVAALTAALLHCAAPQFGRAQAAAPVAAPPPQDKVMLLAGELMAKALFLRGFYMANDLKYDAAGRVQGAPKGGDWTLAGMNVLKVERHSPTEIEIDGLRAVIRYNTELHEFQRHPLNDEKMRLVVETGQDEGNAHALEAALGAIFSVGIDPALQRSMPDYWRHYFDPSLAWPQDQLSGQTIYALYGQADQAKEVTPPVVQHRTDAKFTSFAERDKVQGPLQLRMVVDAEGVPQRITVSRPLGYGLDAAAVEAMTKWRFSPGTRQGAPVATGVVVEQDFTIVARPR